MKINLQSHPGPNAARNAFSLIEVMSSVAIIGVMVVSLYAGFSSGFAVIQLARENLRATQILQEKTETIRLYTWEQINSNGFIPPKFTAPFYAASTNTNSNSGLVYSGTLSITDAPITESYAKHLKLITVTVDWTSGNVNRQREMKTYVSRYGLQNYVY